MPSDNLQNRVVYARAYLFAALVGPLALEALWATMLVNVLRYPSYDKSRDEVTLGIFTVILVVMVLLHIVLVIWRLVKLEAAKQQRKLVQEAYHAAIGVTRHLPFMTVVELLTPGGVTFQVKRFNETAFHLTVFPTIQVRRTYRLTRDSLEDISVLPGSISPSQVIAFTSAMRAKVPVNA